MPRGLALVRDIVQVPASLRVSAEDERAMVNTKHYSGPTHPLSPEPSMREYAAKAAEPSDALHEYFSNLQARTRILKPQVHTLDHIAP